ncbi:MAG: S8 family serine peptidase [Deltaproteobacteria bacterium]|nr:S8 family serine peptidase [Deltaproteobacteria bacterium]
MSTRRKRTSTAKRKPSKRRRAPRKSGARARPAGPLDDTELVEGVLFALKRTVAESDLDATASAVAASAPRLTTRLERMEGTRWFLVRMRKGSTPAHAFAAARALLGHRHVRLAEPALLVPGITLDPTAYPGLAADLGVPRAQPARRTARAFTAGLNPAVDCEWSLKLARVLDDGATPGAWSISPSRGAGVVVGHPDTGYTMHDEVWSHRLRWRDGWNYVEMNADPFDPLHDRIDKHPGHGTGTSSVIMSDAGDPPAGELPVEPKALADGRAQRPTGFVSGTAPAAALVPLRVKESVIHFSFTNLVKALTFATVRGHHVVSMSLGGLVGSDALKEAVNHAVAKGTILVAAAGNVLPWVIYPAAYPATLCLGACNAQRAMWKDSATGSRVDVSAPGEDVWAARARRVRGVTTYQVGPASGTSLSTATTAGIAALWLAHHGVDRMRRTFGADLAGVFRVLLQDTAQVPADWDTGRWGAGIVDAAALLRASLDDVEGLKRRARAPRAFAAASAWSFAELFPGVTPGALEDGITAMVQSKAAGRRLVRDRLLARELHWLLLHDADARRSLRAAATSGAGRGVVATAAAGLPPASKRRVSTALQQVLR